MSLRHKLDGVTAVLSANPDAARMRPQARSELIGAYEVVTRIGVHDVVTDQRRTIGGDDAGPTPVELALVALGSCQAVTYRIWSERLGITFDRLEVTVEADYDPRPLLGLEAAGPGLSAVRVDVELRGPDDDRFEDLRAAVDAHCPLLDLVSAGVPVTTRLV